MTKYLSGKVILITGATGSFGSNCVKYLLKNYSPKKIIVFSRDELKQSELQNEIRSKKVRFFIGDIRDRYRLSMAMSNVDIVIHAAALKQVPAAEYNPYECIQTNIIGAENVIFAAIENNVKKVIALSTDKASIPINLYGATKLVSDKLFIAANNLVGEKKIRFSVVRYGNVFMSRGSVVNEFIRQSNIYKSINVTDKEMTRFHIEINDAVNLVFYALIHSKGGELYVPILPSFRIIDLAKAISSKKINYIGKREGEKIHEEMISEHEVDNLAKVDSYYVVLSNLKNLNLKLNYKKYLIKNFSYKSYNSKENHFLSVKDLKKILKKYNLN